MEEKVLFKNSKGQKIVGILDIPEGDGSFPAVIIMHGVKGFKEQPHIKEPSQALANAGFVSLRFDTTNGIGESDGDIFDGDLTGTLEDLKSAIDFVETLSYVDNAKIGITGHSLGGQGVLIVASQDDRVNALVPMCAVFDPKKSKTLQDPDGSWKEKGYKDFKSSSSGKVYKVSYHFYEDRMNYTLEIMRNTVRNIKVPTRIIQSENDQSVPLDTAEELFSTLNCEKDIHIIKGAPHTFKDPQHISEVSELVVEWFEKHLK